MNINEINWKISPEICKEDITELRSYLSKQGLSNYQINLTFRYYNLLKTNNIIEIGYTKNDVYLLNIDEIVLIKLHRNKDKYQYYKNNRENELVEIYDYERN